MALIMHTADGSHVSREQVAKVTTPAGTETWRPIAHIELVEQTVEKFADLGWKITSEEHGLSRKDSRYFGVFNLAGPDIDGADHNLCIGLANSHDQSIAARLAVGSRVFVCDNMAFSGEVQVSRKHTRHLHRSLPQTIALAVSKVRALKVQQDARIEAYKDAGLGSKQVHDLVIRALDRGVIPATKVPHVLREYREPSHPEFRDRTAWSLFNAFTFVLKSASQVELPRRTMRLHALVDEVVGMEALTFAEEV